VRARCGEESRERAAAELAQERSRARCLGESEAQTGIAREATEIAVFCSIKLGCALAARNIHPRRFVMALLAKNGRILGTYR
jgi:hypothetical protein